MQSIMGKSFIRISLGALVLAGSAFAQDPAPPPSGTSSTSIVDSGLSFGLRAGYGVPLGKVQSDVTIGGQTISQDLSKATAGMIPLWLDVGYRFNPNWYLGGFFQYGFVLFPSNVSCPTGQSCNLYDMRFGLNVHYHIMPGNGLDPWVGLGAGYEIFGNSGTANSNVNGFEFANAQVGLDWEVSPQFSFGPFAAFTVGQFANANAAGAGGSITNKEIHEWLIFGLRGVFNIGI